MSAEEAPSQKTYLWKHTLWGCFDNIGLCITAFIVPCYTFGKTSEGLGKDCLVHGCLLMLPVIDVIVMMMQREEIRERRGIPGSVLTDLIVVCICPFCAIVQQAQEVDHMRSEVTLAANREPPYQEMKGSRE